MATSPNPIEKSGNISKKKSKRFLVFTYTYGFRALNFDPTFSVHVSRSGRTKGDGVMCLIGF